jgi:hypothetical protein
MNDLQMTPKPATIRTIIVDPNETGATVTQNWSSNGELYFAVKILHDGWRDHHVVAVECDPALTQDEINAKLEDYKDFYGDVK